VAATLDADSEVEVGEARAPQEQHGLDGLELQRLRLDQLDGGACVE